jgi:hypothetical protein
MAPAVSALGCQCLQIQVSDKVMHALEDTLQKVTRQGRRRRGDAAGEALPLRVLPCRRNRITSACAR